MKHKLQKLLAVLLALMLLSADVCAIAGTAAALNLPAELEIIEERAFYGDKALRKVVVPEGTKQILSRAFANSALTELVLPGTLTYIAEDAFSGCGNFAVTVPENCYAYDWCVSHNLTIVQNPDSVSRRYYLVGNTYPGTSDALDGPDNDVKAMTKMLSLYEGSGYTGKCSINVSAGSIKQGIASTFAGADSNDVSLFYYSGHGTSSGSLCGTGDTFISVSELRTCLDQIPGTKIVLLDCCYSGAHINRMGKTQRASEFTSAVISEFKSSNARGNLAANNYQVLTACSQYQMSSSLGIDDFWFGAFTYGVCLGSGYDMLNDEICTAFADDDRNGAITLGEAYNNTVDTVVNDMDCDQSAQYYGDTSFVLWHE